MTRGLQLEAEGSRLAEKEGDRAPAGELMVAIPQRRLGKDDYARKRAERAELCLQQMIFAALAQTDPATWFAYGLLEARAYFDAVATGGRHPLIDLHRERAGKRAAAWATYCTAPPSKESATVAPLHAAAQS
jgi:hypothetical protein